MVADLGVVAEFPRRRDVFFGLAQVAFREVYPAQRVPVSDQRRDQRQVFLREAVERDVAQRGRRGRDRGLGILLGAVKMRIFQRKLVGDVVPGTCGVAESSTA